MFLRAFFYGSQNKWKWIEFEKLEFETFRSLSLQTLSKLETLVFPSSSPPPQFDRAKKRSFFETKIL